MQQLRDFIIGLANLIILASIVLGTLMGFIAGGSAGGMGFGFSFGWALIGGLFGFLASAAAMTLLALLVDIRATLLRIEAAGGPARR